MVQYNETFPPAPRYNELQNTTYMPQSISYMYGYMYIAALCVYVFGMYVHVYHMFMV